MKKNLLFAIALIFGLQDFSSAQNMNIDFLNIIDGENYGTIHKVKTDQQGNIFITGSFQGTFDFDFSASGTTILTSPTMAPFIAKYSSTGDFMWVKNFPNNLTNNSNPKVEFDANGNVYFTAVCMGNVDLDPGSADNIVTLSYGSIVVKLSANGEFQNGFVYSEIHDLKIHNQTLYLVGAFGGVYDFNPAAGVSELTSAGGIDGYIASFDLNLNFTSVKHISGEQNVQALRIDVGSNNVMVVVGDYTGTMSVAGTSGNEELTGTNVNNLFMVRYAANGDLTDLTKLGGSDYMYVTDLHVGANNSIFVSGEFDGTVDFNPGAGTNNFTSIGGSDAFLVKLSANGDYQWTYAIGSNGWSDYIRSIDSDENENVYITGSIVGNNIEMNPNGSSVILPGLNLAYIAKLNSNGILEFAQNVGYGNSAAINPMSLKLDGANILLAGTCTDNVTFLASNGNQTVSTNGSPEDAFFMKYSVEETSSLIDENQFNFILYPNPASQNLYVTAEFNGTAKVLSLDGRIMETFELNRSATLDLSKYPVGIYFIRFENGASAKFVKQ